MKVYMKIYFGKVPNELCYESDDYFVSEAGDKYYYCLESSKYGVMISDTIGRHVPIDVEGVDFLSKALYGIAQYEVMCEEAEQVLEEFLCQS